MDKSRLFLKLTPSEHTIFKIAKTKMHARSYRDLIVTLLDGEYVDYICNSALTERALRKISVNLHQLYKGCRESKDYNELVTLVTNVTAYLSEWNNKHLQPVFSHRENIKELQVRLSLEEKDIAKAAKSTAGFRTYAALVMHLCCAFISDAYNLPATLDYGVINEVGIALNAEAKYFNTYGLVRIESLNKVLDSLYELTNELCSTLTETGGHYVS